MKRGFVSAILPDLSLEEVVELAVAEGYSCVELMCWPKGKAERRYAGVTHLDIVGFSATQAAEVNARLAQAGISISALGYYPNPLAADEIEAQVYRDYLKEVIRAAALLGVPVVNTFIGRDPTKSLADNWPRFCAVWPPLVENALLRERLRPAR
jgi:sugar phosphate isomerase/epimerase